MGPNVTFTLWAAGLGLLSAVSLPLGSLFGLRLRIKPRIIGMLGAFGAGALLAALAVELVAPTLFDLKAPEGHGDPLRNFYAMMAGLACGGVLYFLLDQTVNARGGFLRRTATAIVYFRRLQRADRARLIEQLAQFPLLQTVPSEHIGTLLSMVKPIVFHDGDPVIRRGRRVDRLVIIAEGTVAGVDVDAELGPGDAAGLGPLVMDTPSPLGAVAKGRVTGLALSAAHLARLREISPEFDAACIELTRQRIEQFHQLTESAFERKSQWLRDVDQALLGRTQIPTSDELRGAKEEHSGAPLAIWLGMTLDGIPESFVIGSSLFVSIATVGDMAASQGFWNFVPYTLIAGLFLSNFPEALASSANMKMQGWKPTRIFLLWVSLMLITGAGAMVGYAFSDALPHTVMVFAEGVAAGAMLTMIAAAMIPEAVHLGGPNTVGLSTLAGFLAAISFKLLE
jgi:zinc transporter ZupT